MRRRHAISEKRNWQRLPIAVPVFVRGVDERGNQFLEFTTALDVSAGGILVALRRSVPEATEVVLEIPSAPAPGHLHPSRRTLVGRLLRRVEKGAWHLCAFGFDHPLLVAQEGK